MTAHQTSVKYVPAGTGPAYQSPIDKIRRSDPRYGLKFHHDCGGGPGPQCIEVPSTIIGSAFPGSIAH